MKEEHRNQLKKRMDAKPGEAQDDISVEFEPQTIINEFPQVLQGKCSANFLFNDDFSYLLDFDIADETFFISILRKNV
jgi:hypothetical protein